MDDADDKGSEGFGFVTMSRGREADNARIRLNQAVVEGRIIEVNLATPRVVGLSKTPVDVASPAVSPASAKALKEAELKLAQAQMEVLRLWEIVYFLTTFILSSFHLC